MSDTVMIEISVEAARQLANNPVGEDGSAFRETCKASCVALAKRHVDTRAERLGLPWRSIMGGVADASGVVLTHSVAPLTGEHLSLILAAPDMAEVLEDCMQFLIETGHSSEDGEMGLPETALAVLRKAGWQV